MLFTGERREGISLSGFLGTSLLSPFQQGQPAGLLPHDFLDLFLFLLLLKTSQVLMHSSNSPPFGPLSIQIAWILILVPTLANDLGKLHDLLETLVSCW